MSWLSTNLTWRCDICGKERPDAKIAVHRVDITPAGNGLPPGTVTRNVKYCNDTFACMQAAREWREKA